MLEKTSFVSLCEALTSITKKYENGEIKHYDYMNRYEALLHQYRYTKQTFIKELGLARNKKLHHGK